MSQGAPVASTTGAFLPGMAPDAIDAVRAARVASQAFGLPHRLSQCAIRRRPGRPHLRRERGAKALFERPEQGSSDECIVMSRDAVALVPFTELPNRWQD